jgi:DNA gyrase/topoisomerase IV subunit B
MESEQTGINLRRRAGPTTPQIKVLEGLEAVPSAPPYIGNRRQAASTIVYEVVDNSVDEAQAGCDRSR